MKINGVEFPEHLTHDEAADLFMTTAVGQSTGVTRDEILRRLRERFPTENALAEYLREMRVLLEGQLTPAVGPYTLLDHGHVIRCNTCAKVSWNTNDVIHKYCGHCKRFHED